MARPKRLDQYRYTNLALTPPADRAIRTIRLISYEVGYRECTSDSDAVVFATTEMEKIIKERHRALNTDVQ